MRNRTIGTIGILKSIGQAPKSLMIIASGTFGNDFKGRDLLYSSGRVEFDGYAFDTDSIMWDTGASETCVYAKDKDFHIESGQGEDRLFYAANGDVVKGKQYQGTITLFNGLKISGEFPVMYAEQPVADVVIGMNVISNGKFTVDGRSKTFTFET